MARQISTITNIDHQSGKRWTALVQVLECQHLLQTKQKDDYKRIMLTDSDGTKLTALIFSSHLNHYANIFRQYRRYYISNVVVLRNDPKYSVSSYPYSWILNNRTLVEEFIEPNPTNLPCKFEFTPFNKLHRYADSENLQNVRGIVVRCLPSYDQGPALVSRRDIIIVDEQKTLLVITLWNQFDEHEGRILEAMGEAAPLIFGMRLKVTTFNSVSLTTRSTSGFLINPPVTEDLQLRNWYNNNRTEIQQLLERRNHNNDLLLPYPNDEEITPIITAVASFETSKTSWVKGKLTLPVQERGFSYTGCANCQKALEADTTWIVTCPSCKLESEIIAMSRVTVIIDDGTGTVQATMCTPDVDKFIPFTATELMDSEEIGNDLHTAIANAIQSSPIVAFIRAYVLNYRGTMITRVNIVKAYTPNEKPISHTNPPIIDEVSEVTTDASTSGERHVPLSETKAMAIKAAKDDSTQVKDIRPMKKSK